MLCDVLCLQLLTIRQNNSVHGSHTIIMTSVMEFEVLWYRLRNRFFLKFMFLATRSKGPLFLSFLDGFSTAIEIIFQKICEKIAF